MFPPDADALKELAKSRLQKLQKHWLKELVKMQVLLVENHISVKKGGDILLFYAAVDDRPLLVEVAVVMFSTDNGTFLLCSFYRHPHPKIERLARWEFDVLPDWDFSGGVATIGQFVPRNQSPSELFLQKVSTAWALGVRSAVNRSSPRKKRRRSLLARIVSSVREE